MRRSYSRAVRKDRKSRDGEFWFSAPSSPRRKKRKSSHKVSSHRVGGRNVRGFMHNGRFYMERKHYRKGTRLHHSITHKGKVYHTASHRKHSGSDTAKSYVSKFVGWTKGKYRAYKDYKERKKSAQQMIDDSENSKEKSAQDIVDESKKPRYGESKGRKFVVDRSTRDYGEAKAIKTDLQGEGARGETIRKRSDGVYEVGYYD